MGRRSINTTKSGKFMNPTDQARKEARKRELKKNKRQRMIVRHAVLKGKDPSMLVEEMEILDKLEYDTAAPPKLNEKVVKDKRKKLKEMFDRVIKMYEKEDLEYATELRKMEKECEKSRVQLQIRYEQVRNAERVQVDQIPLPDMPIMPDMMFSVLPGDIPLPQQADKPIPGILKKTSAYSAPCQPVLPLARLRKPPGPPPGTPPELSDSEDEEYDPEKDIQENFGPIDVDVPHPLDMDDSGDEDVDEDEDEDDLDEDTEEKTEKRQQTRRIRFADDEDRDRDEPEKDTRPRLRPAVSSLQAKMLQLAGQKVPMMTEVAKAVEPPSRQRDGEERSRERRTEKRARQREEKAERMEGEKKRGDGEGEEADGAEPAPPGIPPGPPPGLPPTLPQGLPPGPPPGLPPMMFRPPPLRGIPMVGPPRMLPPGPPPGRPPGRPPGMPPGPPPGLPPNLRPPPMNLPQGLPLSRLLPRTLRPPGMDAMPHQPVVNPSVLSAPPSLLRARPVDAAHGELKSAPPRGGATIEAKPQIKSLGGDVTRFMPTALRVKRNVRDARGRLLKPAGKPDERLAMKALPTVMAATKDDAYDTFMQEMEGLL